MNFDDYVAARGPELLRLARLLCNGDLHRAEDLVQTALAKAYGRWSKVSAANHPDAYVRKLMVNANLDWRSRFSSGELPVEEVVSSETVPDIAGGVVDRDLLKRALSTLSPKQRTVLVLRYYLGLPDHEIAELMSVREVTVRVGASRALTSLRDQLGPSLQHELAQEQQ